MQLLSLGLEVGENKIYVNWIIIPIYDCEIRDAFISRTYYWSQNNDIITFRHSEVLLKSYISYKTVFFDIILVLFNIQLGVLKNILKLKNHKPFVFLGCKEMCSVCLS